MEDILNLKGQNLHC